MDELEYGTDIGTSLASRDALRRLRQHVVDLNGDVQQCNEHRVCINGHSLKSSRKPDYLTFVKYSNNGATVASNKFRFVFVLVFNIWRSRYSYVFD